MGVLGSLVERTSKCFGPISELPSLILTANATENGWWEYFLLSYCVSAYFQGANLPLASGRGFFGNSPAGWVISGGLLDRWEFCAAGQPLEEAAGPVGSLVGNCGGLGSGSVSVFDCIIIYL